MKRWRLRTEAVATRVEKARRARRRACTGAGGAGRRVGVASVQAR